jgi:signal transduction histidine kinase
MDTLHQLIGRNQVALIARWQERVRGSLDPTHSSTYEIENSLPAFLDELTQALAGAAAADETGLPFKTHLAEEHGRQRFRAGMNLATVILEYGVLEDCILELAAEQPDQPIALAEYRSLAKLLNAGIADASREFMRQRDAEIQRQASEHFAFLAHEIRSPLGSIALSVEVLKRTSATADDPAPARIGRALERLQRVIDDSIVEAQIRSLGGQLSMRAERLSVHTLIGEVAEECMVDAAGRNVSLTVDEAAGIEVDGDRRLLRSVLSNLVRNAIKFTRPGGQIRIYASSANDRISIEVEDECGGLPPGKTEEMFLPFRQHSPDRSGFGLGLAIAKQAVEAHSGSLQVRNLVGRGCVFMVDLPAPVH